jgi:hypothetical protein
VKWTPADIATLKRLAGQGFSAAKIAQAMGRHRGSVCWQAKRRDIRLLGQIGVIRNAKCRMNPGRGAHV